ncbi:MFS transporter [Acinetobacter rudis]|uniref:MFS transporter n=1 Tax=Acinetobacter rudis TaxID=632955 RepID=A0AAW8JAZ2_9GAMM|nr:MFS transporter [Acinetobacter rudis]MDQ8936748.1 MFS transporter [Acinetobacter rudis]MDQ9018969.1 MFS transporter [Acinetobacter rudis]
MKKNDHILGTRRFLPMFLTQFFGALNDNVFKQSLVVIFTFGWIQHQGLEISTLNNLAALLFILPFFIFSATAGQIADKYERSKLIRAIKILEILIMLIATLGFMFGSLWLLIFALFLMGTHSTFFGPIKYAILPDILNKDELVQGNAIFQSGTSIAILIGMVLGGAIIFWSQGEMLWISLTVLVIAIVGYLCSRYILPQPIPDAKLAVDWNFLHTSIDTLRYAKSLPTVFLVLLGNSWYWFYGATFLTQIPLLAKQYLHGSENVASLLLMLFSVGIGIGSLLCKKIGGTQINLKVVMLGCVGLTLFAFYLTISLGFLPPVTNGQVLGLYDVFHAGMAYYHVMFAVALLGIFGGFYIVPLYTMMQAFAPVSHRARVVSANNILNAIFMVTASIFSILILSFLELDLTVLFNITAILSAIFSLLLLKYLRPLIATTPYSLED